MIRLPSIHCAVLRTSASFILAAALPSTATAGVDPESNTDGFNPAADLYDIAETQRQGQVAMQHALVDAIARSVLYGWGDLWGPPIGLPGIRQPYGYESKQVGPSRWIYRPLYAEDVPPPQGAPPEPRQPAELPAPADAAPEDFVPPHKAPPKPAPSGPREF
jgi:hypothetical protein